MKKIFIIALCIIFSGLMLTACSKEPVDEKTSTSTENTTQANVTSGVEFVQQSEYFSIVEGENVAEYIYEIYNASGETVLRESTTRPLTVSMLNNSVVDIAIGMGTGIVQHTYYDAEKDIFSEKYTYVVAVSSSGVIAYISGNGEEADSQEIVIRDVFDKSVVYKTVELKILEPAVNISVGEFSEDGKTLEITYTNLQGETDVEIVVIEE